MPTRLEKKVQKLKAHVINLGDKVEKRVEDAIRAVLERDPVLGREVAESDREIDLFEIEVEEDCLACLALDQPVAMDLRFVVAVLKINNDLERIADLAVNIAEQAEALHRLGASGSVPFDMAEEAQLVRGMMKDSVDALVGIDAPAARRILTVDDQIDAIHMGAYDSVREAIEQDPSRTAELLRYLSISRSLERIADHVTNIAEDIIYTVSGEIFRHNRP
ncbi:MAG: phosphate signaling complex protein PhoU [Planctomycetota bacterium]